MFKLLKLRVRPNTVKMFAYCDQNDDGKIDKHEFEEI